MTPAPAIISIHDVMPQTLGEVSWVLDHWLADFPPASLALLVVPGLDWAPKQLDTLRAWQVKGYELAGHGWFHRVRRVSTLQHRLHSHLISRQAAEHLSLETTELVDLLTQNYQWFSKHDFKKPELYVPPAWAMGQLDFATLERLPFRYYEFTSGLLDSERRQYRRLPLAGFEADCRWRVPFLWGWNGLNRILASSQRPLRLSIHPYDHRLLLARTLRRWLTEKVRPVPYRSLFDPAIALGPSHRALP